MTEGFPLVRPFPFCVDRKKKRHDEEEASLRWAKECDDTLVTSLIIVLTRTEFILGQKRGELPFKPAVFSPSCSNETWGETLTLRTAAEHTGNQKTQQLPAVSSLQIQHVRQIWSLLLNNPQILQRSTLWLDPCLTVWHQAVPPRQWLFKTALTLAAAATHRQQTEEQRTVSLSNTFNQTKS